MNKQIRIASWNIAGAHKYTSSDHLNYEAEDISYFAEQLKRVDPDIIFLQETHLNSDRSIARDIANLLNYENVYEVDVSPSHIDSNFRLGNAIISKAPLSHIKDAYYPYPDFELRFPNGKLARDRHDKMVQIYKFGDIMICNTQMCPLSLFGYSYVEGLGKEIALQIEDILIDNLTTPLIFAGDFNTDEPEQAYPKLVNKLGKLNYSPRIVLD